MMTTGPGQPRREGSMSHASRALRVLTAGSLLVIAGALPVSAADPTAATVTITVPDAPIVCRVETEVSALVLDAAGATIAGTTVTWSIMPVASSQDSVVEYETTTGSQGVATTRIWSDCTPGSLQLLSPQPVQHLAQGPVYDLGLAFHSGEPGYLPQHVLGNIKCRPHLHLQSVL
jgi:hypothetical protein